ncbi:3,4-dihydroxy-2-butanone-4-phosphate synthase [Kordiimonas sp.]|uniref:3,4-dihydroxy-2-butanone-4-phosphate synthase n=1 Tax=Kordiimonas sp. TaxID=1970157 RepID=UPI003A8DEF15
MNQTSKNTANLGSFGTPTERVERAVNHLRAGGGVLVMDDETRENEGDIIFPASTITEAQMALLIREGTGIVCLAMPDAHLQTLELPQMVQNNTSGMGTAFTVSIEAKEGVTTGVSAADRVTTIRAAIAPDTKPHDLARPGHVFPLRAHPGGITARAGHTEASIDLVERAGHPPAAVLCELTNPDGTMARLPEIVTFAEVHGMPVVTIDDLKSYMANTQARVA